MHAMVLHDFGDLRWEEVPDPEPAADEVVIAVACVQPSVTETMLADGAAILLHDELSRRLADGPIQFGGHEFSGVVRRGGRDARGWAEGTRVLATETVRSGPNQEYLGFTMPGAFAELVSVPAENLIALPEGLSAGAAAAVQPATGALHAHAVAAIRPGETVLVIGCGVMGLHAIQLARHGNAGLVMAAGRSQFKRDLASRLGADVVLDGRSDTILADIDELTGSVGVDVVIETAGGDPSVGLSGSSTVHLAARACARGGRIVVVSVLPDGSQLPLGLLRGKGIGLLHPNTGDQHSGRAAFRQVLRLISRGDLEVEELVTHRLQGLDQLTRAMALTRERPVGLVNPPQVHSSVSWDEVPSADH